MDNTTQERRYKLLYVSQHDVIMVIDGIRHEHLSVPAGPPLPDNARVVDVQYDLATRGFSVLLFSPEWDVVEDGAMIPRIVEPFGVNVVRFRKGKDGKWGAAEENPLTRELTCGDCGSFDREDAERFESRTYCETGNRKVDAGCVACFKIVLSEEAKE